MDFNNLIRGFFGIRPPKRDKCDGDCENNDGCQGPGECHPSVDIWFHDRPVFDMVQPLDPFSIFQQMEDAFNNFFSVDPGRTLGFDSPPEEPLKDGSSYRDFLLNPSERDLAKGFWGEGNHIGDSGFSSIEPFIQPRSLRDQLLNPGYRDSQNLVVPKHQQDSDIDEALHTGEPGHGTLKEFSQHPRPGMNWSFRKSVSIRTVKGSDGTVEEHRTERDSSGNEVTTVRKSIGDQSYSVTLHKDSDGVKEKREDLVNLDEKEITQFEERWHNMKDNFFRTPRKDVLQERDPSIQDAPGDPHYSSIFKKLFRF